ncbi:MAG: hypothetical protein ACD_60C00024G0029 [uncultured bacterium]|nr:MAG: hypothetical protein ACD_60C00024G0029 [uncultured bacterium]
MFISILKCIHLLLTLSLLGTLFVCAGLSTQPKSYLLVKLHKTLLWLAVFAILTGTLLIYPKHYSFHTPWIKAAYLLVFLFATAVSFMMRNTKKGTPAKGQRYLYVVLLLLLIIIIHDAVTKTTFLF